MAQVHHSDLLSHQENEVELLWSNEMSLEVPSNSHSLLTQNTSQVFIKQWWNFT